MHRHATLLAAPPTGPVGLTAVADRLEHHGFIVQAVDAFHPAPEDGSVAALAARLAQDIVEDTVLVATGLAVPLALHMAEQSSPSAVVLANGPMWSAVDPITRALSRWAQVAPRTLRALLRPGIAQPTLASSAALRRLVVNPYVMDHDMVVRVTEDWTSSRAHRAAVVQFLASLPAASATAPTPSVPTMLVWGDEDILYPAHVADGAGARLPGAHHARVPGGRHLHAIERPWELADAVHEWLSHPGPPRH